MRQTRAWGEEQAWACGLVRKRGTAGSLGQPWPGWLVAGPVLLGPNWANSPGPALGSKWALKMGSISAWSWAQSK